MNRKRGFEQLQPVPEEEPDILKTFAYCRGNQPPCAFYLYSNNKVSYQDDFMQGSWSQHPRDAAGHEWLEVWFHCKPQTHRPKLHWFQRVPFTTSYILVGQPADYTVYLIPMELNPDFDTLPIIGADS